VGLGWLQFSSGSEHLKLAVVLFQNLFPPINVQTVKLGACQVRQLRQVCQHGSAQGLVNSQQYMSNSAGRHSSCALLAVHTGSLSLVTSECEPAQPCRASFSLSGSSPVAS